MKSFKPQPWLLPQPVVIIGTYDQDGKPNAMNAAWAGTWDMDEIMISLSNHATTENLDVTGEFTVTFATKDTLVASDFVGLVSAKKDPNKVTKTGWSVKSAPNVNAPVFTDFPLTLECKVYETINRTATGFMLIGKIVGVLCDEKYLAEDGKPDVSKMQLITYDPVHLNYIQLGEIAGKAFSAGKALK
ncbi:MAG: flavin reductase [Alphaproteobacteria bacterium]|nr:flavin reductase [Alphaproteobacteria bacterium]